MRRCPLLVVLLLLAQPAWAGWTHVSARGNANEKTSDTSVSLTPTATVAAGAVAVVSCNTDNSTTTAGATTDHTVSDSQSNTWTRLVEWTRTSSSAADGVTASLWASQLTTQLTTSDSVTCTTVSAVTAKVMTLNEFSVGGGNTISVAGGQGADGTGTAPSVTLSGLTSAEYLWIGNDATEGPSGEGCVDANFTQLVSTGTTGGSAASNVATRPAYRVLTATSETYDCTRGAPRDFATLLAAMKEETGGGPTPQAPLRRQVITRALPAEQ
jgi:hypothetical protein